MSFAEPIKVLNAVEDIKKDCDFTRFKDDGNNNDHTNITINGIPGIGKSKVESKSDLIGQYVGHTRQNTQKIIDGLMASGGILFFDEPHPIDVKGSSDQVITVPPLIVPTPPSSIKTTPKFMYAYIETEPCRLNHTALYKAAEKTGKLKIDTFQRIYYTAPSGYGKKDKTSREHDEVISRSVPCITNFSVAYRVVTFTKSPPKRFITIYKKYRPSTDSETQIIRELNDFVKHYRRHDEQIPVTISAKLP